jgi:hypothetical protein
MRSIHCVGHSIAVRFGVLAFAIGVPASALAAPSLDLSRTTILFGRIAFQVDHVQPFFIANVGDAPLNLSGLTLGGANPADFRLGGTCAVPSVLAPGDRCRVDVTANLQPPNLSGNRFANVTVQTDSALGPNLVGLNAQGAADATHGAYADPPWIDFGYQAVGTMAAPQVLSFISPEGGTLVLHFDSVALVDPAASDFTMTSNCVVGNTYQNGGGCSATIGFTPSVGGPRSAEIEFQGHPTGLAPGFVTFRFSVTGYGGAVAPVTVVEYYNQVLDHYFITWIADEQANLDAGKTPTKWDRTGYSFRAYVSAQAGTSPVCRYYLPPAFGDSHFFGRGTAECNATGAAHPGFILESSEIMDVFLPVAGNCPSGTTPIYRVFSNRADANHRYMTDRGVRDQMVAKGWLAEGDGPDLVVMCAP